jgi:4'-phosphopantetheinyl transferase
MRPWHADVLSDGERARRGGLWDERHRAQFTVAAALLRLVVAPLTARMAAEVVVDRSCPSCGRQHGRPRLPGTGLHVSISHSGATVAVAVSSAGAVGVDVQQVVDDSVDELSPLVLAESEAGHVAAARDFFTYWTRKEALVKATGDGVAVPLGEVVVSPPGTPPRLLGYPRPGGLAAQLRDLSPDPGYVGALAVLGPGPLVVRERSAERLLVAG